MSLNLLFRLMFMMTALEHALRKNGLSHRTGQKCRARSANDMQTTPAYEQVDHEVVTVMGHQHEHCELNSESSCAKTLLLMPVSFLLLNTLAVLTRG